MAFPAQSDWLRWCIPAGRISGVRVGIHWTFPLFILLYTLNARVKVDGHWALVVFSALVLLYGITEYPFYTVLFGIGRAIGTLANITWDRALGYPIERPKSLTTGMLEDIAAGK
jgi:hypothetical protein